MKVAGALPGDDVQRCVHCVLPASFPGISFGSDGVCNHCRQAAAGEALTVRRYHLKESLEAFIRMKQGSNTYDCVVAYSGGKDSTYTLMMLVQEYGLNCLSVTVDNGFLSKQALRNIRVIPDRLGIDAHTFRPSMDFMNRLFTLAITCAELHTPAALTRASGLCNACITLISTYMQRVALQQGIPLVAGGYIGGQVPRDSAVLEINPALQAKSRRNLLAAYARHLGPEAFRYFDLPEAEVNRRAVHLTLIHPMLTIGETESEIIATIRSLGWEPSPEAGEHSSNCLLNDLGIAMHHRQYGFHPYTLEIATQVRQGRMTRDQALDRLAAVPQVEDCAEQLQRLGLDLDCLPDVSPSRRFLNA